MKSGLIRLSLPALILFLFLALAFGGLLGYNYPKFRSPGIPDNADPTPGVMISPGDSDGISPPSVTPLPSLTPMKSAGQSTHTVPSGWNRVSTIAGGNLTLCLPPKWESDGTNQIYFARDPGYRPGIYIGGLAPAGSSRREAYYKFWEKDYPSVRTNVPREIPVNSSSVLNFSGPEGEKLVWTGRTHIWEMDISSWNYFNTSKNQFLKDVYTMISCSF